MNNKLSELSKPAAYDYQIADACIADGNDKKWVDWNNKLTHECPPDWMVEDGKVIGIKPLYSQEYVSALLAERDSWKRLADLRGENWEKDISNLLEARERIAELEQKERHSERQNVIDGLAGAGEAWSDIEEYMVKWDEGRRNG
ncbi:hypothetical protein [Serratia proteamaculans]